MRILAGGRRGQGSGLFAQGESATAEVAQRILTGSFGAGKLVYLIIPDVMPPGIDGQARSRCKSSAGEKSGAAFLTARCGRTA
jgi:hypothetical protein